MSGNVSEGTESVQTKWEVLLRKRREM
jgi:hypothetical protein